MAGDSTTIFIGAAWVYFGTVAGNVGEVLDLGYSKGGITLTLETGTYEILVDQEGQSPVGEVILGRRCTVMVPMAESNYERLQKIIPDSAYASEQLDISSGIGDDLMDYTDLLLIEAKANSDRWVKIWKAAPVANLNANFVPDAETLWPVQFKGYIPETGHAQAGILLSLHEPS